MFDNRFEGIGRLANEKAVTLSPAYTGAAEPGAASQAAIFNLLGHPHSPSGGPVMAAVEGTPAGLPAGLPAAAPKPAPPPGLVRVLGPCLVATQRAAESSVVGD